MFLLQNTIFFSILNLFFVRTDYVIGAFLDPSKAFDKVQNTILVKKYR